MLFVIVALAGYLLPWQNVVAHDATRLLIGFGLFLIPGMVLVARGTLPYLIVVGFALSMVIAAVLGLIAVVGGFSSGMLLWGYTCVAMILIIVRPLRIDGIELGALHALAAVGAVCAIAFSIYVLQFSGGFSTYEPYGGYPGAVDNFIYNAYVVEFASADQLSFEEIVYDSERLPISRFWIFLWPAAQGIITRLADVNILDVHFSFNLLLVLLAALATLELATALLDDATVAVVATMLHFACLFTLMEHSQPGQGLVYRINQDKFFFVFFYGNVLFRTLLGYRANRSWGMYAIYALVVIFSITLHSASAVIYGGIVGGLVVMALFADRDWRYAVGALAPFAVCAGVLLGLRLMSSFEYATFVLDDETVGSLDTWRYGFNDVRSWRIPGTVFTGANYELVMAWAYYALGVAWVMTFFRRNAPSDFVLVTGGVVLVMVIPFSGWLIGLLITPFQLWRYLAVAPFGIGIVYGLMQLRVAQSRVTLVVVSALLLVVLGIQGMAVERWTTERRQAFDELLAAGELLAASAIDQPQVIAVPVQLSYHVPSIQVSAQPYSFRDSSFNMTTQTGLSITEAEAAIETARQINRLFDTSSGVNPALIDAISKTNADYLLVGRDVFDPAERLATGYPGLFEEVGAFQFYRLYKLTLTVPTSTSGVGD